MRLRILFVEDSEDDVELMLRRLRDAGLEPQWDRVAGEPESVSYTHLTLPTNREV